MSASLSHSDTCSRRLCGPVLPTLWLLQAYNIRRLQLSSNYSSYPAGYYPTRYGYGLTGDYPQLQRNTLGPQVSFYPSN
jgi:hypothetical protein